MKQNNLTVKTKVYQAKRKSDKPKPKPNRPNSWWGIDMTKFLISSYGWVNLIIVLDWYTKKVVGFRVAIRGRTAEWKEALKMAVSSLSEGSREFSLNLMSDNGCQPTSTAFMKLCSTLGINQAFTCFSNPKGNADTERFIRTIKEELIWLSDWQTLEEAQEAISKWIVWYNELYVHSSLGYKSPEEFEKLYEQTFSIKEVA